MVITTTSAAALTAGSTLTNVQAADRPEVLVLLTLMAGVMMMAAGLLKLGRYTRFVSISVMIGFLTGVATNIGSASSATSPAPRSRARSRWPRPGI